MYPGTLTANATLVANSTSGIDKIITANLVPTSIFANGSSGGVGFLLTSTGNGKLYWKDPSLITVGQQYIQNTDSRTLSGNLVFSGSNQLFSGANVNFTGSNTQINALNVTTINRSPTLTLTGDVSGSATFSNLGDATLNVTVNRANGVILGVDTTGDYVADIYAGNGIATLSGTGAGSAPTIAVQAGTGVTSNSSGVYIGQDVAKSATVQFQQVNVTGSVNANNLNIAKTFSTQDLVINGNTTIGDAIQDIVTINAAVASDVIPQADGAYSMGVNGAAWNAVWAKNYVNIGGSQINAGSSNTINVGSLVANADITANTATIYHNLTVGGSLYITGNVVSTNVETLSVADPMIHLGTNNHTSDTLDLGFYADYYDGSTIRYSGLIRDASDGNYKLFNGLTDQPQNQVNTASTSYVQGNLWAYLNSGALVSGSTGVTLTANNTLSVNMVANTLTLSTPLAYSSGGTGFNTYVNGDLLVGNTSSGLQKLSVGSSGYVLQSDGTNLYWGGLDGGTF